MAGRLSFGGAGEALSNRNYRYYWLGNAVSILGFWLHKLALGVFTWHLTESPFWLGAVGFAALFPAFIMAPYAGAVADRFGMRRVASLALLVGAAAALGMGLFAINGGTNIVVVFAFAAVQGVALAFDLPARQGLVPALVARSNLSSAIALNTTTFHLGAFVGPALFGVLERLFELHWAFFLNAVSFILFVFCLQALKLEERSREDGPSGTTITAPIGCWIASMAERNSRTPKSAAGRARVSECGSSAASRLHRSRSSSAAPRSANCNVRSVSTNRYARR